MGPRRKSINFPRLTYSKNNRFPLPCLVKIYFRGKKSDKISLLNQFFGFVISHKILKNLNIIQDQT